MLKQSWENPKEVKMKGLNKLRKMSDLIPAY